MEIKTKHSLVVKNGETVLLSNIPLLDYTDFYHLVLDMMKMEAVHCVSYYAHKSEEGLKFICCLANDDHQNIHLLSHVLKEGEDLELKSLTEHVFSLHIFEREICENWGVNFVGHPWLKPVRYAFDRKDQEALVNDYPFYKIESEQLHEVGVGPIHAGIIEPGHFRFICNGEMVLHLEIQNGWQHRGIEKLFLQKSRLLQRNILSESITGDTAIGHSLAFVQLMESLGKVEVSEELQVDRSIALELERTAMHTGDISGLCVDTAYQLGANVVGALRTPLINFFQSWCGNRFGKGLIRVGGTNYPLTSELRKQLAETLEDYKWRFHEITERTYDLSTQQNRFDGIGTITTRQAQIMGNVGMVARMANVKRDTRWSHPFAAFKQFTVDPDLCPKGDVFARFLLRRKEVESSLPLMGRMIDESSTATDEVIQEKNLKLQPNSFTISMTEGWRGEICHTAITNHDGEIVHYKIKDPSMHNWKALELSLRDLEISDFPINNKSYDLSYSGNDL